MDFNLTQPLEDQLVFSEEDAPTTGASFTVKKEQWRILIVDDE